MAKGVPTDTGVMYFTETFPDHPLILRMNEVVAQNNLDLLSTLIDEYLGRPVRDPSPGSDSPPGYLLAALEPVFLYAILQNLPSAVALLMTRGVRLCNNSLYKICEWNTSSEVYQVFLDHGWDINKQMNWARPPPL
jgi:hypothetical protein